MPGSLIQVGALVLCPHGGSAQITSGNSRVMAGGQALSVQSDTFLISGCVFFLPLPIGPHPCFKIQWLVPATRVRIGGQAPLLQTSSGLCLAADQLPQGPPIVSVTQTRVRGT